MRADSCPLHAKWRGDTGRRGFSLIELLVVIAIVGFLFLLLMPAVRTPRHAARRSQCRNNLKQIGLALHNYHDSYGVFPPAYTVDASGRKLHSWRTLVLPYLDQAALYEKIDLAKPWDDPVNAELTRTPVQAYFCPSMKGDATQTTYHAVVSPESILRPEQSLEGKAVTDGLSNTLIVVEVESAGEVPWASPEDHGAEYLQTVTETTVTSHEGGSHGLLADGSVRFFDKKMPADVHRGLISAAAGDKRLDE